MKRILLSAFVCACAAAMSAQTNLVVNGGFDEELDAITYTGEDGAFNGTIKGWTVPSFDIWNFRVNVPAHEDGEGDLITEGNTNYLKIGKYHWNGWWGDLKVTQTVSGLEVGKTYTFSILYRCSNNQTWRKPYFSCGSIKEEFDSPSEWTKYTQDFVADAEEVTIELFYGNISDGLDKNADIYACFDEVSIIDPTATGISNVSAAKSSNNVRYTLGGVRAGSGSKSIVVENGRKYIK